MLWDYASLFSQRGTLELGIMEKVHLAHKGSTATNNHLSLKYVWQNIVLVFVSEFLLQVFRPPQRTPHKQPTGSLPQHPSRINKAQCTGHQSGAGNSML